VVSDRYRIIRKLGEGGVGGVYYAEHLLLGRGVALKVLLPDINHPEAVEHFLEEARTVARVGHENVIDISYGGRSPDGFVFLAMEYLEGVDLGEVLRAEGPLDWERARPILIQIAQALEAVHRHGIVHRDIKPENVFLIERDGRRDFVKLLDFGVATIVAGATGESRTSRGPVAGTPDYMAPEQAQGTAIDQRADVYAVGCLMYRMITGEPPFKASTMVELLGKHVNEMPVPPSVRRTDLPISAEMDAVVMRALEKSPARRWPDMAELGAALARCRNSGGGRTARPSSILRINDSEAHRARRRRGRVVAVLGLAVAVAGGIVGYQLFTAAPGQVHVSTVPADATVALDGVPVATRAPLVLDATPGRHTVSVARAGYTTVQRVVEVASRGTVSLPIALAPAPDTGLEITSEPPGLAIWLDGAPLAAGPGGDAGQARTNFLATGLPAGRHVLEIGDRAHGQVWRHEVEVAAGAIRKVEADLRAEATAGP
jgi:serine/threonine-protein kinase